MMVSDAESAGAGTSPLRGALGMARRPVAAAGLAGVIGSVLTAILVILAVRATDSPQPSSLLWAMAGLVMARALVIGAAPVARAQATAAVRREIQGAVYRYLLMAGPAVTDLRRTGDLVSVATDAVARFAALAGTFIPLTLRGVATPVVVSVMSMTIDFPTGAVLLFALPVVLVALRGLERGFRAAGDTLRRSQDELAAEFLDSVSGLETLVLHGAVEDRSRRLAAESERVRSRTMDVLRVAQRGLIGVDLIYSIVSVVAVVAFVGWRFGAGAMDGPEAVTLFLLSIVSISALVDVVSFFYVGGLGLAASRRLRQLFALPVMTRQPGQAAFGSDDASRVGGIELEDVTYTYPGSDRPAVEGITLSIGAGTSVAVVGGSGAGKSTLASLLLGHRRPQTGRVGVAGLDPAAALREDLARQISYVGQETFLFSASVADNLRVAHPTASDEQLVEACRKARLDEVVDALPEGLATQVGERGRGLSGGEAQRLGIARAFLADPPILVLDEATSGLDLETEALVNQAIGDLLVGRTAVVIAHRITTARRCGRVIRLEAGNVVADGAPRDLGDAFFERMSGGMT